MSQDRYCVIIVWANNRPIENKIDDILLKNFLLRKKYEIIWSESMLERNFSRLLGRKILTREINRTFGRGAFLLYIFEDSDDNVLEYIFEKNRIRSISLLKGNNANRAVTLILGKSIADSLKDKAETSGTIILKQDLVGANGWENLEQFFYVLNNTINYCILRNAEDITRNFTPVLHGDIDFLVEDRWMAQYVMNAEKVYPEKFRVTHNIYIAGVCIPIDIHYLGDNYYCKKWEYAMLYNSRKIINDGIILNVMQPECQYYSLIYHAYLQKYEIAKDYPEKLALMAKKAQLNYKNDDSYLMNQLKKYMDDNNYSYVLPHHITKPINWGNLRYLRNYHYIRFVEKIEPKRLLWKIQILYHKILRKTKKIYSKTLKNNMVKLKRYINANIPFTRIGKKCLFAIDKLLFRGKIKSKLFRIDAGHEFLKYGEPYFVKNANAQVGRAKLMSVSVKDLVTMQIYYPMRFRSWVMAVHTLYLEYLDGKNQVGADLEKKMLQQIYGEEKLTDYNQRIVKIRNTEWKDVKPLDVDRDLRLVDGALRLAIALYDKQDFIMVRCADFSVNQYIYGRDYLLSLGFDTKELRIVENKVDDILEDCRYLNTCIIWPPARNMHEELLNALSEYEPDNISIYDYWETTMSYEELKGFIELGYKKDDAMDWALQMKSTFMLKASQVTDDIYPIRFVRLRMQNPDYIVKPTSGQPYSRESLRCKETLRSIYKNKVQFYERDVVIHISDNYLQSKYIWLLAHINRDLSKLFVALESDGIEYAAVGANNRSYDKQHCIYAFGNDAKLMLSVAKKDYASAMEIVGFFVNEQFAGEWLKVRKYEDGYDVLLENECILPIRVKTNE